MSYREVARFTGQYGTATVSERMPDGADAITLALLYDHEFVVTAPDGDNTFYSDFQEAMEAAEELAGLDELEDVG